MEPSAPLLAVAVIVAFDLWVYADAKTQASNGFPVFFRAGSFAIETPAAWFMGCLLVWIVFFPLYLAARTQRPRG
jgi:hypothetical protein